MPHTAQAQDGMSGGDTERLAELVRAKRSCLAQLRELGRRQLALIDEGDMARLLELLAGKQRLIEQLQRVERAMDPFRGEDPESRPWPSPERRRRCADEVRQCETLLAEVLGQEKLSESALTQRRDAAAARLQGAHAASLARGAYAAEPAAALAQLDLLSES